jgi:hypothetical protein
MSAIQQVSNTFDFHNPEIHLLASIKYWGTRSEAGQSQSYSRIRKRFMSSDNKNREMQEYSQKKHAWADQWYAITSRLLEIGVVLPEDQLKSILFELKMNEAKKNALSVELATFTPYFQLKEKDNEWDDLSFDEEDRKTYLDYCAGIMDESPYSLKMVWDVFNKTIEKIVKANTGPNFTIVWAGLGAVLLLCLAPYLAGVIGGFMGLGGAAATSAGLALLGGGSLASGGFGMTGGYVVLMAGGAILGYGPGSVSYRQSLRQTSKEELLLNCAKLYSGLEVFQVYNDQHLEICRRALQIQNDLESDADSAYFDGNEMKARDLEAKAQVMRSFRRLLRGDLT